MLVKSVPTTKTAEYIVPVIKNALRKFSTSQQQQKRPTLKTSMCKLSSQNSKSWEGKILRAGGGAQKPKNTTEFTSCQAR